jgi:hypothetical protein
MVGMGDGGIPFGTFRPWVRGSNEPAWMVDRPGSTTGNCEWFFETSVVCRRGRDAGKVYAVLTWGFKVDANLKITPMAPQIYNKPSPEFEAAVKIWNDQATGPLEKRNAPHQRTLPEMR